MQAGPDTVDPQVERVDAALPQTQCTRCGYADCRAYASAIVHEGAPINRCPPGGAEGVTRLAAITGQPVQSLDVECGSEGPRTLAVIDEAWCIGCTLCIKACPVDCIIGASKRMHTVIDEQCTGCELCVPACPVDCIALRPVTGARTGWAAWSPELAQASRQRYRERQRRQQEDVTARRQRHDLEARAKLADLARASAITDPAALERKRAVVTAALERARVARTRTTR